jgi:hypothetical protein
MRKKFSIFFTFCIFTTIFLIVREYLSFIFRVEEMKLKMMKNVSSSQPPSKFGHNFTMVHDWKPRKNATKYVLFWGPYIFKSCWGHGENDSRILDQQHLNARNCPETNCHFTHDVNLLPSVLDFDAVIYNCFNKKMTFPELRSPHQLYIMTANE